MSLDAGLDTGPVHVCRAVAIGPEETSAELEGRLSVLGTELLVDQLRSGLSPALPQHGEATIAAKIEPEELHLDWREPAIILHRRVRLGGAWTTFRGRRLIVSRARVGDLLNRAAPGSIDGSTVQTGDGGLVLVEVQPEGRAAMSAEQWRNGARLRPDDKLGG
jgi:methionyl-tRNA formyltransferase